MWKKRLLQYALFWVYTIFALVIPCILVIEKYELFRPNTTGRSVAVGLIFAVVFSLFYFRKHLSKAVDGMMPCAMKSILVATREMIPLIMLYVACVITKMEIKNLEFIVLWSGVSNLIAYGIRIVHLRYRDKVIEEYHKSVIRDAVKGE